MIVSEKVQDAFYTKEVLVEYMFHYFMFNKKVYVIFFERNAKRKDD